MVVPATQKVKAGGSLESRSSRPTRETEGDPEKQGRIKEGKEGGRKKEKDKSWQGQGVAQW
jgi:hypothetical protein